MDPILSLAFSMQSSRGLYALLLGSGASRAARIPTGWDITLDLIGRVAAMEGANCEPDPTAWYVERYEREPNYSELLQNIARTSAERSQVLRRYFEPDDQERERGEKLPTAAHTAIAELVAAGYIRVIITTNFDRLVEQALQVRGVQPTVVSSAAQAQGLGALSQIRCLVFKVHGDYLEANIRNTPAELGDYEPPINTVLDRVLDEFGLVVCGWSAEYDRALVQAIERSRNRRYSTYWTGIGEPAGPAGRLIQFRQAVTVRIESADLFFRRLAEHVGALEKYRAVHPLSVGIAVARLKAYLAEPEKHRIELHDLITESTNQLCTAIAEYRQPAAVNAGGAALLDEMIKFEKHSELLLNLVVNGMWWGDISQAPLWQRVFSRLASPEGALPGHFRPVNMKLYPSLLSLYAAGIACCATENYGLLHEIINGTTINFPDRRSPFCREFASFLVIDSNVGKTLPGYERHYTPISNHLCDALRPFFKDFVSENTEWEEVFDRFEYIFALSQANQRVNQGLPPGGTIGRFGWKNELDPARQVMNIPGREAEAQNANWRPLASGLFNGSLERFQQLHRFFVERISQLGWW
jgi:hypothetical protein